MPFITAENSYQSYRVIDLINGSDIEYVTMADTDKGEIERMEIDENGNFVNQVVNGVTKCKLVKEKRSFRLVDTVTGEEVTSTDISIYPGDDALPQEK